MESDSGFIPAEGGPASQPDAERKRDAKPKLVNHEEFNRSLVMSCKCEKWRLEHATWRGMILNGEVEDF